MKNEKIKYTGLIIKRFILGAVDCFFMYIVLYPCMLLLFKLLDWDVLWIYRGYWAEVLSKSWIFISVDDILKIILVIFFIVRFVWFLNVLRANIHDKGKIHKEVSSKLQKWLYLKVENFVEHLFKKRRPSSSRIELEVSAWFIVMSVVAFCISLVVGFAVILLLDEIIDWDFSSELMLIMLIVYIMFNGSMLSTIIYNPTRHYTCRTCKQKKNFVLVKSNHTPKVAVNRLGEYIGRTDNLYECPCCKQKYQTEKFVRE